MRTCRMDRQREKQLDDYLNKSESALVVDCVHNDQAHGFNEDFCRLYRCKCDDGPINCPDRGDLTESDNEKCVRACVETTAQIKTSQI